MDFLDLAKSRFSVRNFRPDPVPEDVIARILAAGHAAPTACNRQPQKLRVLTGASALERLRRCLFRDFNPPLAIIVSFDRTRCWYRPADHASSGEIDASIVATHLMLAAAELDVGSTWVMHFFPEAVRSEFGLPDSEEPVAILVMGYAADGCVPSQMHGEKRPLADTVEFLRD